MVADQKVYNNGGSQVLFVVGFLENLQLSDHGGPTSSPTEIGSVLSLRFYMLTDHRQSVPQEVPTQYHKHTE